MIARRLSGLLPPLDEALALEVTKIHGIARRQSPGLIRRPPVRMPHYTVSTTGLLGGGNPPRPGEVSLAHGGVLVLDELPEFSHTAIDGLREPLEQGAVTIVRARYMLQFPARFHLPLCQDSCSDLLQTQRDRTEQPERNFKWPSIQRRSGRERWHE
jgi:magnesium chelatase family protein